MLVAKVRQEAEKNLPTLTKAELAELLFEQVGLNKREAKDMVETFFDEIRNALERGEAVKLSGFGNFQLRDKPQRPGRNPKTGEEIPITARRVVTFHASQKLKGMVEAFFEEIRGALERGESVKLSGFGNFQLRDKPQRPGRNPKTGEEIPITARRVVTFHASQKLKAMVEEKYGDGREPQES